MSITAIVTAAGRGERFGDKKNKVLVELNGKTILERAIAPFLASERIDDIIISVGKNDLEAVREIAVKFTKPCKLVYGGVTRAHSVYNALSECKSDIVLIHDGARPYVDASMIDECINTVVNYGSAVPVMPIVETLAVYKDDELLKSENRAEYCITQTPQGFFTTDILKAYNAAAFEDFSDDSGIYAKFIGPVRTYKGDAKNKKITIQSDLLLDPNYYIGTGYDMHELTIGRRLILGGVEIPHTKGLLGHSDADVLLHAIMDALLSAACMRDIGYHFSDKDEAYKDIASSILLERVLALISENGFIVNNISASILAEKPKLAPFIPQITQNIAQLIHISTSSVGITATTTEGLGLIGREEGIAVYANALLAKR